MSGGKFSSDFTIVALGRIGEKMQHRAHCFTRRTLFQIPVLLFCFAFFSGCGDDVIWQERFFDEDTPLAFYKYMKREEIHCGVLLIGDESKKILPILGKAAAANHNSDYYDSGYREFRSYYIPATIPNDMPFFEFNQELSIDDDISDADRCLLQSYLRPIHKRLLRAERICDQTAISDASLEDVIVLEDCDGLFLVIWEKKEECPEKEIEAEVSLLDSAGNLLHTAKINLRAITEEIDTEDRFYSETRGIIFGYDPIFFRGVVVSNLRISRRDLILKSGLMSDFEKVDTVEVKILNKKALSGQNLFSRKKLRVEFFKEENVKGLLKIFAVPVYLSRLEEQYAPTLDE